jgi:hypothetical protein
MPRDSSGTFGLVSGVNPVQAGSPITPEWANPTLADVAQGVSESLDRYGRGGMLAPFKVTEGSVATPGMSFLAEPSTGLSRPTSGRLSFSVLGNEVFRLESSSAVFLVAPAYGADPVGANDLTRKAYVDQAIAQAVATGSYLPISGGTLTGPTFISHTQAAPLLRLSGLNSSLEIRNQFQDEMSVIAGANDDLVVGSNGVEQLRLTKLGAVLLGSTGQYAGYSSKQVIRYAGAGTQYGLVLASADSSSTPTLPLVFMRNALQDGSGGTLLGSFTQSSTNLTLGTFSASLSLALDGTTRVNLSSASGLVVGSPGAPTPLSVHGNISVADAAYLIRANFFQQYSTAVPLQFVSDTFWTWQNSSGGVLATLTQNGSLGIGATPANTYGSASLWVGGSIVATSSQFNVHGLGSTPYEIVHRGTGGFDFYAGNTFSMRIAGNGDIGVGTQGPTAKLDVNGPLRVRGGVSLDFALPVTQGGTGSNTAPGARAALGLGSAATESSGAFVSSGGGVFSASFTFSGTVNLTGTASLPAAATFGGQPIGHRGIPRRNSGLANGECLVISPAGAGPHSFTVQASDLAEGRAVSLYNDSANNVTVLAGAGVTLRLAGTATTGSVVLSQRGLLTGWCVSNTEVVVSGPGVS